MNTISEVLAGVLPLGVHGYHDVNGVFLVLVGKHEEWSLALLAPWALSWSSESDFDRDLEDLSPEETGRMLAGSSLIAVDVGEDLRDPVFRFTGGIQLHLRSDAGGESWTMRAKSLPFEIVG